MLTAFVESVRIIADKEHPVCEASGGKDGLEKYRRGSFDLVILDRAMPDMSGDELAQAISEEGRGTPVIMLTGFGDMIKASRELVKGVDLVLQAYHHGRP